MDTKSLLNSLSASLGRDSKDLSALLEGLTAVMKECLSDMDTIALPGFGQFEPVKEDERVATDEESGRRMLLPPAIHVRFSPSALLRRKIKENAVNLQ